MDLSAAGGAVEVSVVVAHHGVDGVVADGALDACLAAHAAELRPEDELIVVVAGARAQIAALAARQPRARVIAAPSGALTPRLWSLGLAAASGRFVRTTIGAFVPAGGWRQALLAAHAAAGAPAEDVAAVGGAIEPAAGLRLRDSAIFFQRYRNYRLPFARHAVGDVPGDHASYRRDALASTASLWAAEFWERDVNRELVRSGRRLVLDPAFVAHYAGGESARRFLVQRFRHGVGFGRARLSGAGPGKRVLYALACVLPGLVFFVRIARESLRGGRASPRSGAGLRFIAALPWLCVFVLAWSLGEWIGALRGPPDG